MLSKVVTNTKNTDKNKIMSSNVSKVNCSLRGVNKIKGGENIYFAIENEMSYGKNNMTRKIAKGGG